MAHVYLSVRGEEGPTANGNAVVQDISGDGGNHGGGGGGGGGENIGDRSRLRKIKKLKARSLVQAHKKEDYPYRTQCQVPETIVSQRKSRKSTNDLAFFSRGELVGKVHFFGVFKPAISLRCMFFFLYIIYIFFKYIHVLLPPVYNLNNNYENFDTS
jgi:hypothetical protein